MKNKQSWKILLAALAVIGAATVGTLMDAGAKTEKTAQEKSAQNKAAIAWQPSLSQAKAEAKRSGKPLFVLFHAEWCGPCKMLENETLTDAKVVAEMQKWVAVSIDVDKEKDIAAAYRVGSLPTMIFVKSAGDHGFRFEGALKADDMLQLLKDAYAKVS